MIASFQFATMNLLRFNFFHFLLGWRSILSRFGLIKVLLRLSNIPLFPLAETVRTVVTRGLHNGMDSPCCRAANALVSFETFCTLVSSFHFLYGPKRGTASKTHPFNSLLYL